jgi:hypothetical protein
MLSLGGVYDMVTQSVASISKTSYDTIYDVSGSLYNAGVSMLSGSEDDTIIPDEPTSEWHMSIERYSDDEAMVDFDTQENIVPQLLAEWTTLAEQVSADDY